MKLSRRKLWLVFAVFALVALVFALQPHFWMRYLLATLGAPTQGVLSFYEPHERIAGIDDAPPQQRVAAQEEKIDPAALEAAAQYAAAGDSRALIVSRRNHIVFERYWHDAGPQTTVDTGQFSAVITSIMVGIALGEHKLGSIEEPASDFIVEWRNDARTTISIRNLLQMSSGLAPANPSRAPWSQYSRERFGSDLVAELLKRPLVARPGVDWVYQSADPQWLAQLIERAVHERYAQYVSRRLWKRLQAADADLWLDHAGGAVHADCCLIAQQRDWMRVAELLLNDGVYQGERLLPPGWVRRMTTPAPGNSHYGFHIWLGMADSSAEPYAVSGVLRLAGGAQAQLWLVPSLALAILRTSSATQARNWQDARIPNLIIGGVRDFVPPPTPHRALDISTLVPHH